MRFVCFVGLLLVSATMVAGESLPKEVSSFIAQREACDHWRGEYGYDEQRQAEIDVVVCEACVGTDERLTKLKRKYRAKPEILAKLAEFEADIEPEDSAVNAAFCKRARSQHSLKP